jgi:hypothetical protein
MLIHAMSALFLRTIVNKFWARCSLFIFFHAAKPAAAMTSKSNEPLLA